MTIAAFQKHLQEQGCPVEVLDNLNFTGAVFKVVNPKYNRKHFWNIYRGGEVSDREIITICDSLFIKYPPHLQETS